MLLRYRPSQKMGSPAGYRACTRPCNKILWPLASLISMSLGRRSRRSVFVAVAEARLLGITVGVLTFTGSIAATGGSAFGSSSPCRYSCRHENTWFAFRPWRRATLATDAPRSCVSSTIRRFSSTECCRRGPVRRPNESVETSLSAEVSTYSLSGHVAPCAHLDHHGQPQPAQLCGNHRTVTFESLGSVIFHLTYTEKGNLSAYCLERFHQLDEAQARAVTAFLEFVRDDPTGDSFYANDAKQALKSYWGLPPERRPTGPKIILP